MLRLDKTTCSDLGDNDSMKIHQCSLLKPLLEHSCEMWNPHTKIDKSEAVQQKATRWIVKYDDDYDSRLSTLILLPLFERRFIRYVTFLFNVIMAIMM